MQFMTFVIMCLLALPSLGQQASGRVVEGTIFPGIRTTRNYVKNPSGFKNASNITTTNAAITRDTDTADKVDGIASLICDASAQNGFCQWTNDTIEEGDKSGQCIGYIVYKGDGTLYQLQVHDGSSAVASSGVLKNASDWNLASVSWPCGGTRNLRFTQTVAGTGPAVNVARVFWGRDFNPRAYAIYQTNTDQTLANNADTRIDYEDLVATNGSFVTTGSSWAFGCHVNGIYRVSATVNIESGTYGTGTANQMLLFLYKKPVGGAMTKYMALGGVTMASASVQAGFVSGSGFVPCRDGEELAVYVGASAVGANKTLEGATATSNTIEIIRIGDY